MNNDIQNILAELSSPLTSELVSGKLCGLVCKICPLRAVKSGSEISCSQILVIQRRREHFKFLTAVIKKLKTLFDHSVWITSRGGGFN